MDRALWQARPGPAELPERSLALSVTRCASQRPPATVAVLQEHAANIRDELSNIGLADVPVIAIHSKRAAFARTVDPYEGPDPASRKKLRDEVGTERLLAGSNLSALEDLLAAALKDHAEELRLGMLREQTRGMLHSSVEEMSEQHARDTPRADRGRQSLSQPWRRSQAAGGRLFQGKPSARAVRALDDVDFGRDQFVPVGTEVYLCYPSGRSRSMMTGVFFERTLGRPVTVRNWSVVTKLAELAGETGR